MAQDSYLGILEQFGLQLPDEQKARQLAREQRIQQAMQMGGLTENQMGNPLSGTFGRLGATVGSAIANRYGNPAPELPPELQSRYELVRRTKDQFSQFEKTADPSVTPEQKEEAYQRLLIKNAFDVGLPDIGTQMIGAFKDQRLARQRRDKELEKLGYEVAQDKSDAGLIPLREEAIRWKAATERYTDLYSLNGEPLGHMQIDAKGNAVDASGRALYRPGEYLTAPPPMRSLREFTGDQLPIPRSRVVELQNTQRGARDMMAMANRLADIMDGATTRDPNGQVLGWGGDVARTVTTLADNIRGATNALNSLLGGDGKDGTVMIPGEVDKNKNQLYASPGSADVADAYKEEIDSVLDRMPASFRQLGLDATRARTTLMSLAYAIMRAEEPGNSRYSDDDYKRALILAGEGLADPNKLRANLWDRISQYDNQYQMSMQQLSPEWHDQIWAPPSRKAYEEEFQRAKKRFAPAVLGDSGMVRANNPQAFPGNWAPAPSTGTGEWKVLPE